MVIKEQVWLVTGASSGLGKALVEELIKQGYPVVATARNVNSLETLPQGSADILKLSLDVTKSDEIIKAVQKAEEYFGKIDVLVNNAGYGYFGALEETEQNEAKKMMETNFWGANNMTLAVLPEMRKRRSGRIINVTSIGGLTTFPTFAYYHASKFAMEGLFQSLRQQVSPLGVHVTNVEPGSFRTEWAGRSHKGATNVIEDYELVHETRQISENRSGSQPGNPRLAAKAIVKLANMNKPPMHYILGGDAFDLAIEHYKKSILELEKHRDDSIHQSFGDGNYWE
ncbi:oxidoreductase [Leuconostoc suionicum]|uniref:oxidoreductase n=1 Tax=Leuconostoc suionicum TaxID=1511761 RepID=UPI00374A65C2